MRRVLVLSGAEFCTDDWRRIVGATKHQVKHISTYVMANRARGLRVVDEHGRAVLGLVRLCEQAPREHDDLFRMYEMLGARVFDARDYEGIRAWLAAE